MDCRRRLLNAARRSQQQESGKDGFQKIQNNVFYREYSNLDRSFAEQYIRDNAQIAIPAACSGAISPDGNIHGRNLDWYYNDDVTVIARTPAETVDGKFRHASIGVCLTTAKEKDLSENPDSDIVKIIPFRIDDGVNDAGLTIQINVIPRKNDEVLPADWHSRKLPDLMAVRVVLDDFDDAREAAEYLADNVYLTKKSFSYHWMISDAKGQTWLVEDFKAVDIGTESRPFLTNFRISDNPVRDGSVDWDFVQDIDPHGMGVERYETILSAYGPALNTLNGMADLMQNRLRYTNAYRAASEIPAGERRWDTESCGVYPIDGRTDADGNPLSIDYDIKAARENTDVSCYAPGLYDGVGIADLIYARTRGMYLDRENVEGSWWTTWTALYDRADRAMHVRFHEDGEWLKFRL